MTESSGIAASRRNPGAWFTHDDSGGGPEIHAFRLDGTYLGRHRIEGANSFDWEDMAAGPCPQSAGDCLFLADTGDNFRIRPHVTVYAVEEPARVGGPLPDREGTPLPVIQSWKLLYPEGKPDVETLLVHPLSGAITLVTKEAGGGSLVYRAPTTPSEEPQLLQRVAELHIEGLTMQERMITGGGWQAQGESVAIRSYVRALEWTVDPLDADAHWERPPRTHPLAVEVQGEAIAYTLEGDLVTTSEGHPMPVSRLACLEWEEQPPPGVLRRLLWHRAR